MVFHDVSKESRLFRQLSYQASHDALTGLINRSEFENCLVSSLDSAHSNPDHSHALLYLDLDQFKVVNDTFGHIAGDELLRQIAELVKANIRSTDIVARLGGDEFGILLERCTEERRSTSVYLAGIIYRCPLFHRHRDGHAGESGRCEYYELSRCCLLLCKGHGSKPDSPLPGQ